MSFPTITLITPVFNDGAMVGDFIQSVLTQTYPHWQLILVNDGSTDETPGVLDQAAEADARISVLHQPNSGQQQAILNAQTALPPDHPEAWVMLAHADDLLNGPTALENQLRDLKNPELEGLYAAFETMDEQGKPTGALSVPKQVDETSIRELFLNGGSNPIPDHFFCRQAVFKAQIIPQYLLWNTPYWLNLPLPNQAGAIRRPQVLRLAKAERSWYRYRVYEGNYITTAQGRFVMSHGALRTTLALSRFYRRVFPVHWRKRSNGLKRLLGNTIVPAATPHSQRKALVLQVLKAYYGKDFEPDNRYHKALLGYYSGSRPDIKSNILASPGETVWLGKDSVAFYQALESGCYPAELERALEQLETQPRQLNTGMQYFFNLV